jgi:hypothetical protein
MTDEEKKVYLLLTGWLYYERPPLEPDWFPGPTVPDVVMQQWLRFIRHCTLDSNLDAVFNLVTGRKNDKR